MKTLALKKKTVQCQELQVFVEKKVQRIRERFDGIERKIQDQMTRCIYGINLSKLGGKGFLRNLKAKMEELLNEHKDEIFANVCLGGAKFF